MPFNEDLEMENAALTKNSNSFQNYGYEVGSEINYDIPANLSPVPPAEGVAGRAMPKNKDLPAQRRAGLQRSEKQEDLPACKRDHGAAARRITAAGHAKM